MMRCLLDILSLELSMLVVFVGFLQRDGNYIKYIGRLLEDVIHFLKGTKTCFGEEEVD